MFLAENWWKTLKKGDVKNVFVLKNCKGENLGTILQWFHLNIFQFSAMFLVCNQKNEKSFQILSTWRNHRTDPVYVSFYNQAQIEARLKKRFFFIYCLSSSYKQDFETKRNVRCIVCSTSSATTTKKRKLFYFQLNSIVIFHSFSRALFLL